MYLRLKQASASSGEGNLEMQLNLYTMNLTGHIAAHMETLPMYPALSTAVIIVCVGFKDVLLWRGIFFSLRSLEDLNYSEKVYVYLCLFVLKC